MKRFNGTVTLAQLDEDNTQRVIFRIIPLCTKEGLVYQNRLTAYPEFGSLRVIPDKREQSSFKERMHTIGCFCCIQLLTDGKELTKIRQNRNYDPNQGEYNQYAIYSDVICGFEQDAIFEVFPENDEFSHAATETVLIQRGKVLFGPVPKHERPCWETLKPFSDEKYLLHTVVTIEGNTKCFCWNPEAVITWRQRKKTLKRDAEPRNDERLVQPALYNNVAFLPVDEAQLEMKQQESIPILPVKLEIPEPLPIGSKLELLDKHLTNDEHITALNKPLSEQANHLKQTEQQYTQDLYSQTQVIKGTPILNQQRGNEYSRQPDYSVQGVVEKQLKTKQNGHCGENSSSGAFISPIDNLRSAFQDVWQRPALHQELLRVLSENKEMLKNILLQLPTLESQSQVAQYAVRAEIDEIEARRISLLIEIDKLNADYGMAREKFIAEISTRKLEELGSMEQRKADLQEECHALEKQLNEHADTVKNGTANLLWEKVTFATATNGADIILTPTTGFFVEKQDIVEVVRSSMSSQGFLCKQACVAELMILLALYDDICLLATNLWEGELYAMNLLRSLGLLGVSAWPSVFGTLKIASFLPNNDLRTPTIEVIRNNRTSAKTFGHKVLRLIDQTHLYEFESIPIFRVPELNKQRMQEERPNLGKPISLQTIHAFGIDTEPLYKGCEDWFERLRDALRTQNILIADEVIYAMRTFIRIATPQVIGGFLEAVDAATLFWVVPILMRRKLPKNEWFPIINGLPRCMRAINAEPCTAQ